MLPRSIPKCYSHRLSLALKLTPRVPAQPQWRSSSTSTTTTRRFQSSSAHSAETTNLHEDNKPHSPASTSTIPSTTHLSKPQLPNPTTLHSSLPTFQAHATRTGLSPTSTTYIGTHYEYTVAQTLRRLAFNLQRTGGRGDAGIDLLGTWHLPPQISLPVRPPQGSPGVLRVLVQCKALKAKLGPNLIRELEGAFVGAPAGYRTSPSGGVVGVLVSPREATKGVRDAMGRSRWPMVWVMLEVGQRGGEGEGEGRVMQVLWNKAAAQLGLEGLDVTVRYDKAVGGEDGLGRECVLMWQGRPVPGWDERQGG